MLLVLLMYALFASVFTVGKVTLQYTAPFFLTGVRMVVAGGILLGILALFSPQKLRIQKKHLPYLLLLAFFNVFITNAFEFWGLQYMETAKTSLIYSLSPFAAILFSYLFLSEKMTRKKWFGLCMGLAGFIPIFFSSSQQETLLMSSTQIAFPEIAVSISALTAVIGWIVMKKLMRDFGFSFVVANGYSFLLGGLFSLIISRFTESWTPLPLAELQPFLFGVLYIAIIHNVICYNLYGYSLNRFSVSFMTFAGFTNPLFTALFGWIFLHETVGLSFFLSLALILLGIFLYSQEELKQKRPQG